MEDDLKAIGRFQGKRPHTPYEEFIEEEGIPIIRGLGVYDVRELDLKPWRRMGGHGAYLELSGLGNKAGFYVVEIPPRAALNAEKHMYEEMYYVVEGRGSTEVWRDGRPEKKQLFEWQKSSLFSPPLNTWHCLVNASSSPARLLVGTNAPPIMEMYRNRAFVFDNSFQFYDRYPEDENYFKPAEKLSIELTNRAIEAVRGRTSHDAGAGPEGSPPLGGSCQQRHTGNRPPATGCRVLSRLGRDGAGGCHRPRPPAATPPDEA